MGELLVRWAFSASLRIGIAFSTSLRPWVVARTWPIVILALVGGGPAGCTSGVEAPGRPAVPADVAGRVLVSTAVVNNGKEIALQPGQDGRAHLRMTFVPPGSVGLSGGCNSYSSPSWTISDGRLNIGRVSGGLIDCPNRVDHQDKWFVDFVESAPRVTVDGATVYLAGGTTLITLADGTWQ